MADIFEISGRIHSTSQEHVTSPADEILDTSQNKKQHLINSDVARHESEINSPTNGLNKRVADIEALGQIGDTPVETNASNIINNTSLNGKVPSASAVNGVYNAVVANAGYYTCDSEASTAAKVVEASGYVLTVGGCIKIKMTNANTVDDATLNINSTGAKALYYEGERASATNSWEEGETVEVYYDGTSFYANNVAGGSGSGDGAFDVSAKYPTSGVEGGNTYTLTGALAVLNANLSASKKKGGMSIKFVQSSDHKYVQARCMAQNFTTDVTQWQGVDNEPTAGSKNLVESGSVKNLDIQINGDFSISFDVTQGQTLVKSFDIALKKNAIITLNTTTDLVSYINVYKNGVADSNLLAQLYPNQESTFTLTEDIGKLVFQRVASAVIGTGTISISGKQTNNIFSEISEIKTTISDADNEPINGSSDLINSGGVARVTLATKLTASSSIDNSCINRYSGDIVTGPSITDSAVHTYSIEENMLLKIQTSTKGLSGGYSTVALYKNGVFIISFEPAASELKENIPITVFNTYGADTMKVCCAMTKTHSVFAVPYYYKDKWTLAIESKEDKSRADVTVKTLDAFLDAENKAARDSYNLFDYTKISNNVRLKGSSTTGVPKSATGYFVSDFIPVTEDEHLVASFNGTTRVTLNGYCTYNENKQGIQYIEFFGNTTIPSGASYIRVEAKHTSGDYTHLQIQEDAITPFEPYGAIIVYDTIQPEIPITIKADGTGDYTSIRQAFETEGDGKTYEIYEGTYEVSDDFTAEEIANASYSSSGNGFVGVRVPNNAKVIGIGNKENIIIKLELDPEQYAYSIRDNIATLNLFGSCEIENVTILAIYARVAVHDDFQAAVNSKHIFRNCILRNEVVERTTSNAYGLGLRSGLSVEFYECDFYPGMGGHSNVSFSKSAYIRMENCNVYGGLGFLDGNSGVACNCTIINTSYSKLTLKVPNETQYMNFFLNTECKNPVILSGIKKINGYMVSKYPAKPAVTAGDCVYIYIDSHSIPHCQKTTSDFNAAIGVVLFNAAQGEMATILRFDKYIDASVCGIDGEYGQSVSFQNGRLVVGNDNVVGSIINYGGSKIIRLIK